MRKIQLPVTVNDNILNGIESRSWPFSEDIVSVSYSKNEANGQNIFVLQDHDFKAEGWKTFIAYDEIHTNMARLCNFHIFDKLIFTLNVKCKIFHDTQGQQSGAVCLCKKCP